MALNRGWMPNQVKTNIHKTWDIGKITDCSAYFLKNEVITKSVFSALFGHLNH